MLKIPHSFIGPQNGRARQEVTRPLDAAHVDGGAPGARTPLGFLELLLQALQLEDQWAFLCAQSLQHGLLLDQRFSQLMQAVLQLRLATAAQRLVGQLERKKKSNMHKYVKLMLSYN